MLLRFGGGGGSKKGGLMGYGFKIFWVLMSWVFFFFKSKVSETKSLKEANLVPIDGGHDEHVGGEVGPDHLGELDGPADGVAAVEVRVGEGPDQLRQQREEGGQQVGQGQVQDEVVHAGHLGAAEQDGLCVTGRKKKSTVEPRNMVVQ